MHTIFSHGVLYDNLDQSQEFFSQGLEGHQGDDKYKEPSLGGTYELFPSPPATDRARPLRYRL